MSNPEDLTGLETMKILFIFINIYFILLSSVASATNECAGFYTTHSQTPYEIEFSSNYNSLVQSQWQLYFKTEWTFFSSDKSEGSKKIKALEALGFHKNGDEVNSPTYKEFLKNYLTALKKAGHKIEDSILPALVLVKGPLGQATDHRLITPGLDPWPTEPGYRFLLADEMFNIPFRAIISGLQRGRFPLMDASHDVAHFVSFLLHPNYARQLLKSAKEIPELAKYPISFSRRLFYSLELLTLANPERKEDLRNVLLFPGNKSSDTYFAFSDYMEFFSKLSRQQLIKHAEKLILTYDSYLLDYGGGVARSYEKNEQIVGDYYFKTDPTSVLFQYLGSVRSDLSEVQRNIMGTIPPVLLSELLKMRRLDKDSFQGIVNSNSFLGDHFNNPNGRLAADYGKRLDRLIALQVARLEYGLWETSHRITVEKWVAETLSVQISPDSEIARFVRDFYGLSSPLYQFMIPTR